MRWRRLPTRLVLLGAACFFCLMAEGGSSDWSAKLVRDGLRSTAALGAVAYAVFSIAMGAGRLATDALWTRWGAVGLLRRSGALAAVGFAAGLAGNGAGHDRRVRRARAGPAGVVPTLFRSGADQPGVPPVPRWPPSAHSGTWAFSPAHR